MRKKSPENAASPDTQFQNLFEEGKALHKKIKDTKNKRPLETDVQRLRFCLNETFQHAQTPAQKKEVARWAETLESVRRVQENVEKIRAKTVNVVSEELMPKKRLKKVSDPEVSGSEELQMRKERADPSDWETIDDNDILATMLAVNEKAGEEEAQQVKLLLSNSYNIARVMATSKKIEEIGDCLVQLANICSHFNLPNRMPCLLIRIIFSRRNIPDTMRDDIWRRFDLALAQSRSTEDEHRRMREEIVTEEDEDDKFFEEYLGRKRTPSKKW